VIAAIDWVVAHRDDDPAHPVPGPQPLVRHRRHAGLPLDPLTHAVENAWRAGIVVVVAAATAARRPRWSTRRTTLRARGRRGDPAGTVRTRDDTVTDFSSRATPRRVDLVAPGRSVVSLRDPAATSTSMYPEARVGTRTPRAAAPRRPPRSCRRGGACSCSSPDLTPDQVKQSLLPTRPSSCPTPDGTGTGAGELNVWRPRRTPAKASATQTWPRSTGLGSLGGGPRHLAHLDRRRPLSRRAPPSWATSTRPTGPRGARRHRVERRAVDGLQYTASAERRDRRPVVRAVLVRPVVVRAVVVGPVVVRAVVVRPVLVRAVVVRPVLVRAVVVRAGSGPACPGPACRWSGLSWSGLSWSGDVWG
jgi:hypothetical protein